MCLWKPKRAYEILLILLFRRLFHYFSLFLRLSDSLFSITSVCLSTYLTAYVCICLPLLFSLPLTFPNSDTTLSLSMCLSVNVSLSVCLSVSLFLSLPPLSLSPSMCVCCVPVCVCADLIKVIEFFWKQKRLYSH